MVATVAVMALLVPASVPSPPSANAADEATSSIADTYDVSSLSDRTNGDAAKVSVGYDGWDDKIGYLKFAGVSGSDVAATLNLSLHGGTAGTIKVHQVSNSWDERDLSSGNAPELGDFLGQATVADNQDRLSVPLKGLDAGGGAISLALIRTDGGITRIASKEATEVSAPKLMVESGNGSVSATPESTDSLQNDAPANCTLSEILVPSCGTLFGASSSPIHGEPWNRTLLEFEETAGRTMDIAHFYERGQSDMFPNQRHLNRQNEPDAQRILFFNWKPNGLTWRQVANGAADDFLLRLADHMKANAHEPFFLSLNAEMEDEVDQSPGSGQTAADFRAFFRHVVSLLRENGVDNMVTVMNYVGSAKWGTKPWFDDLYPGNDVVDWIAQDSYSFGKPPIWLTDFSGLVNRTHGGSSWPGFYNWAAENYPNKPQMLGEWGVEESSEHPDFKNQFFETAAQQLKKYPKIKALVYWNSDGYYPSGEPYMSGETHIGSASDSLNAFQAYVTEDIFMSARAALLNSR
ncbi:hypothetical protein [Arthrobacter castelli]|uniref:hypothetical protein n=1 Tax=Arthrobacter castelli TaxID=271431 RepID=UPI0003F7E5E4|nr:hypothetical protein [Arthrobacter castelli]